MLDLSSRRLLAVLSAFCLASAGVAGCGGDDDVARSAATSLQEAMDATSRAVDEVRPTRSSLRDLTASLESADDQTDDVVGVLTGADGETEARLLSAAREQRSFLQAARRLAESSSRGEANTAAARVRAAGRAAGDEFAALRSSDSEIAGLLPSAANFSVGRLVDAARAVNKPKSSSSSSSSKSTTSSSSSGGSSSASGSNCGSGVSVNGNTSCAFAFNVANAFADSGGARNIEVYSPVTGRTYAMTCTPGIPTVCRGGNNAVVTIR